MARIHKRGQSWKGVQIHRRQKADAGEGVRNGFGVVI